MKNSLETNLGIFVAFALIASVVVVDLVGGFEFFHHGLHVSAYFNGVSDLKVGDAVKMAGVNIGRVQRIELADAKVKVSMSLNQNATVRTDSKATIRFTGLMGQNYIAIDFGTPAGAPVVDGAVLVGVEQADLNSLMAKLDNAAGGIENLTKSFTGDKIDNLLGPITDFMKQNSGPLTTTISNISNISGQIASGQGTVGQLIYSNELYNSALATVTNLQDAAAQVKSTIADAQGILHDINDGKGTIGRLVKDDTLYNETTGAMTNLHQIMIKINNGQGTVGKLINDPEFYKNAKLTLQKLDKATEGLEDQGPMSVLGTAAGNLF
jgi:phospholipid/cholesterol/gamma-HCH transport system substrate-binding protein